MQLTNGHRKKLHKSGSKRKLASEMQKYQFKEDCYCIHRNELNFQDILPTMSKWKRLLVKLHLLYLLYSYLLDDFD